MAVLQLSNGKFATIDHEKAVSVWNVLQGNIEGTPEQQQFCLKVKRVFLNWRRDDLPLDYRLQYQDTINYLRRYHSIR